MTRPLLLFTLLFVCAPLLACSAHRGDPLVPQPTDAEPTTNEPTDPDAPLSQPLVLEPPTPDRDFAQPPPPDGAHDEWPTGSVIEVEWRGNYYAAVVLGPAGNGLTRIHYEGYDASWDESVSRDRMRWPTEPRR